MTNTLEVMEFYGLTGDPFGKVNGDRIFRSRKYSMCMGMIEQNIRNGEMMALVGPAGCGKTTLIADLESHCARRGDIRLVHVGHPGRKEMTHACIYDSIAYDLGAEGAHFGRHNVLRKKQLAVFLAEYSESFHVAIILDEAHRYRREFLQGIKEFNEISYADKINLLGIIFVGWQSFLSSLHQFSPDVYARLQVARKIINISEALGDQVSDYVKFRMKQVGGAGVFDESALRAIATLARTPLKANSIAWEALEIGYKLKAERITAEELTSLASMKEWLGSMDVTNREISRATGFSDSTVSAVMLGTYRGNAETAEQIMNYARSLIGKKRRSA